MPNRKVSTGFAIALSLVIWAGLTLVFTPSMLTSPFQHRKVEEPYDASKEAYYLEQIRGETDCQYNSSLEGSIPYHQISRRICLAAVENCPQAIRNCPEQAMTREAVFSAAGRGHITWTTPSAMLEEALLIVYCRGGRGDLSRVRDRGNLSQAVYAACVEARPSNIEYVPEERMDATIAETAVVANAKLLAYIPERLKTARLCALAVQREWRTLQYVPLEIQSNELYRLAVRQDGGALAYVPFERRSLELCRLALAKGNDAWEFVPKHYFLPEAGGHPSALAEFLARR